MIASAAVPGVGLASPDVVRSDPPRTGGASAPAELEGVGENLYLTGRPLLKNFLRFVKSHAVDQPGDGALTEEWHAANKIVRRLEDDEAGAADDPPLAALGPEYEPLLLELFQDPLIRNGFETVPTDVVMVPLDRIVVFQKHIDLSYVRQLTEKLAGGPTLGAEQVFRTCLLHDHPQPPVKWSRTAPDQFVFMSPSNDLRFLGAMPMHGGQIKDYPPPGKIAGVVGVGVGFGSNCLNAVYADRRLILNNGSHRAYALRELGVTHVPCIVQHLASRDDVDLVAPKEVRRDPDLYLKHPRPPMLKDYFNPNIRRVMAVHRRVRQITVRFEVEEHFVPAL